MIFEVLWQNKFAAKDIISHQSQKEVCKMG